MNQVTEKQLSENDGLITPEVGDWALTKHRKIAYYASLFATSTKRKWHNRIYLDLFSGAGKGRIRDTETIIPGSPLLALNQADPFDLNIFCEKDPECLAALQERVKRYFPQRRCAFIDTDSNSAIPEILKHVPRFGRDNKGLTLCLVDIFKASNLKFETLEVLSSKLYLDFLMLIPTYMDIHRNEIYYTQQDNHIIDQYLGASNWRETWASRSGAKRDFGIFVAEQMCLRMQTLGFIHETLGDLELVRMESDKNQPLYHLAFFSKSELGIKFWRETKKNTNDQMTFF